METRIVLQPTDLRSDLPPIVVETDKEKFPPWVHGVNPRDEPKFRGIGGLRQDGYDTKPLQSIGCKSVLVLG